VNCCEHTPDTFGTFDLTNELKNVLNEIKSASSPSFVEIVILFPATVNDPPFGK